MRDIYEGYMRNIYMKDNWFEIPDNYKREQIKTWNLDHLQHSKGYIRNI